MSTSAAITIAKDPVITLRQKMLQARALDHPICMRIYTDMVHIKPTPTDDQLSKDLSIDIDIVRFHQIILTRAGLI
jgi:hypothetical protein